LGGRSHDLAALPALLRATHLFGLALGSALGKLRDSGVTAAKMFEKAEEQALLLRMMREAAGILGERWDKVPDRHRPHYAPEQRFRILRIRDAFSRMPLSARVFTKEPSAAEIAGFVSGIAKRHGRPAHFVSDQARCFTGQVFRRTLRRLGAKQRFGAIGKKGSIALIERLWRTLKDTLGLRLLRPLVAEDLMEKIELGLVHYAHFRPHQALGGATPAEIYFGRTPAHLSAIPPPRGRPGEGPMDLPFRLEYLDADRMLPVWVQEAA
jgi:hypothetical protein